jgi:hypothetical protein
MKKLLYTLLAVSIIFSACEQEDSQPNSNNNSSSSACGNVTMIIDGTSRGYSPTPSLCNTSLVSTINGQINTISLALNSTCNNGSSDYSISVSTLDGNNLYESTFYDSNCSASPNAASYLGTGGGTVDISNIDYSNKKISGTFFLYGQGKPSIECTFSNVPFTLMAM